MEKRNVISVGILIGESSKFSFPLAIIGSRAMIHLYPLIVFPYILLLGFSMSAARLGLPDTALISYGEMIDQGLNITSSVSIPVIGDADTGYGNAIDVKRTVRGYIKTGFAGLFLEDQVHTLTCYCIENSFSSSCQ